MDVVVPQLEKLKMLNRIKSAPIIIMGRNTIVFDSLFAIGDLV